MTDHDVQPALRLAHAGATDLGRLRTGNEDAYAIDPDLGLFAVADGLGGHRAGEVASVVALAALLGILRRCGAADATERYANLVEAIDRANTAVQRASLVSPERAGMGTTLVAAWIDPGIGHLWLANVGDSRGYLLRDTVLHQLTEDDTLLEALRRNGALPEDRLLWPPRQQLTQALGTQDTVLPRITAHELVAGDRLLLCSDGLTDMIDDHGIEALLLLSGDPQHTCDALVRAANDAGGIDNITVVVVDAHGSDTSQALP